MPSNIYNEGRVVGYSAYEVYVRHSRSVNPDVEPATEVEWLSSTIGMGASMLLKISTDNTSGYHYRDFQFPSNTRLAAANTILGSLFLGEADFNNSGWAQKVTSYGPLLTNDSNRPIVGTHTHSTIEYPVSLTSQLSEIQQNQLNEYIKIVDGIVIQPGDWYNTENTPPKDLAPNMAEYPRVRIYFSDKIEHEFYVLFTGFTIRTILQGVSGLDGSTDTEDNVPEDGGFLGPAIFPWANKIVFSVPNSYIDAWMKNKYSRRLTKDGVTPSNYTDVKVQTITDIDETSLTDYYDNDLSALKHVIKVKASNARTNNPFNVLTVYQRYSVLPPALYAHIVDTTGTSNVSAYPVDVVSPGTVKVYRESELDGKSRIDKINDLETNAPMNIGFVKDGASIIWEKNASGTDVPVADTYTSPLYGTFTSTEVMDPYFCQGHNSGMPSYILLLTEPDDWATNNNYYYWDSSSNSYKKKTASNTWETDKYFVREYAVWFSARMSRRISGTVNHQFKIDCGIGWSQDSNGNDVYNSADLEAILNARYDTPAHGDNRVNSTMYYDIPESQRSNYYFVLSDGPNFPNGPYLTNFTLIPVEMQSDGSGRIDFVNMIDYDSDSNAGMLWYIPCSPYFAGQTLNLLGSYWNSGIVGHSTNVKTYIENKLGQSVFVSYPNRSVPEPTYDGITYANWEEMYKHIKLNDVIPNEYLTNGYNGTYKYGDDSGNIKNWSISMNPISHGVDGTPDYRNLTLYDFLQTIKVHRRADGELVEHGGEQGLKITLYIGYNKSYADAHSSEWETIGKQNYYYPASSPGQYDDGWQKSAGAVRCVIPFNTSINESNYQKSVIIPIPEDYRPELGPQAIINIAGDHQTQGLSLADSNNNLYDLQGSAGTYSPPNGVITWSDLLKILSEGKGLDLLNSDTFLRSLMTFLNSHIKSGTGINSQYDATENTRTLSLSTENGSGISIADGTGGTNVDSSGKHISANLAAGRGIKITNSDNTTQKTIATTFSNGSGITFTEEDGKILIGNAMMPGNLKLLEPGTDFTVYFSFAQGCCGKFQKTETIVDDNHAVYINYSESIDGSPANIYIHGGSRLGITDFGRDDTMLNPYSDGAGFYFRHTETSASRQQASRMLKISFTASGLAKLGMNSALGIHSIADTSSSFTGIWNVGPIPGRTDSGGNPYPSGSCGESWSAVCITEYCNTNSIYVVGISYADGYNTQVGAHYASHGIPAADLFSNHINLLVSCQLYPKTS